MGTVVKNATLLDDLVATRIVQARRARGLTQAELGDQVGALVGSGWSRQVVWQVEHGKRSLTAADLLAVAAVLRVAPADIVGSPSPISLGGEQALRTDVLMQSESALPAVDGWDRFEAAGVALAEVRAAWMRYLYEIDMVRERIRDSTELRERVEAFKTEAISHARSELKDINAADAEHARILGLPAPAPLTDDDVARNATPAMYAARDALTTEELPERVWTIRPHREERRGGHK